MEVSINKDAQPDKRSYRVSFEKIKTRLPAFKPEWDAKRGAEELFAAYTSTSLDLSEFEGPRYQRIGHIRQLMDTGKLSADLRWQQSVAA